MMKKVMMAGMAVLAMALGSGVAMAGAEEMSIKCVAVTEYVTPAWQRIVSLGIIGPTRTKISSTTISERGGLASWEKMDENVYAFAAAQSVLNETGQSLISFTAACRDVAGTMYLSVATDTGSPVAQITTRRTKEVKL
jgi:hypothetical protein